MIYSLVVGYQAVLADIHIMLEAEKICDFTFWTFTETHLSTYLIFLNEEACKIIKNSNRKRGVKVNVPM